MNEAYANAVRDGVFDFVILDGGMGEEARQMNAAIDPYLDRYELRMKMPDPVLAHWIKIDERKSPQVVTLQSAVKIVISSPQTGEFVPKGDVVVTGQVAGAPPNSFVRVEVFTDCWYSLGRTKLSDNERFEVNAELGGQGYQQCSHMLRARLYNAQGQPLAVALNFNIARLNPDGRRPVCEWL